MSEEVPVKAEKKPKWEIQMTDFDKVSVDDIQYQLVINHKEGFHLESFSKRFCDILAPYDYIVGDWGYDQLRLKGFYRAENKQAPKELRISAVEDYLLEYCNFGCAYFILERQSGEPAIYKRPKKTNNKKENTNKDNAYMSEKKGKKRSKRDFVIRRKENV